MKVTMDARPAAKAYSRAFQRLRQLPGFDLKAVLRAEAGSILKQWAARTPVASQREATFRARLRAAKAAGVTRAGTYDITVNTGARKGEPGVVWFRSNSAASNKKFNSGLRWAWQYAGEVSDGGQFTPAWKHYRSSDWRNISEGAQKYGQLLAGMVPKSRASIGLSRQSVIQIADQLGIDLASVRGTGVSAAGIAKARAAMNSRGQSYKNGNGYQGGDNVRAYVTLINRLPYGDKIGMDRSLASVLAGRAKYIETSYQKGAFDSMKRAASAFPNIFDASGLTVSSAAD